MKEYTYKCSCCEKVDVIQLSWNSDIPTEWKCPHCKDGFMRRDLIADLRGSTTLIPNNFKAVKGW